MTRFEAIGEMTKFWNSLSPNSSIEVRMQQLLAFQENVLKMLPPAAYTSAEVAYNCEWEAPAGPDDAHADKKV